MSFIDKVMALMIVLGLEMRIVQRAKISVLSHTAKVNNNWACKDANQKMCHISCYC